LRKSHARVVRLEPPEHRHQQVDGKNPNENDLPKPKIAGCPMISCDFGVTIEKPFSNAENVKSA